MIFLCLVLLCLNACMCTCMRGGERERVFFRFFCIYVRISIHYECVSTIYSWKAKRCGKKIEKEALFSNIMMREICVRAFID